MAHHHLVEMAPSSKKPFEEDFIMISEFSEQEGPKPLLTIPRDAGGTFDKNSFAVRIMAVDYQTGTPGAFQETKDTQVVLSEGYDPATKVYAFVYHFTLHDIHARGYVRPFCMAYMTMDERKILVHFDELLQEFCKVAEVLKHGNWPLFDRDLVHSVSDLEHTHDELQFAQARLDDEDDRKQKEQVSCQLEQCTATLEEMRNILSVVQVLVGRNTELDAQVSRFEEMFETHRLQRPVSETNLISAERKADEDNECAALLTRKRSRSSPPMPDSLGEDAAAAADPHSIYHPQTLDVLKVKRFDQKLRSLVGLCGVCAKLALAHLRRILNHYGRDHEGVFIENEEFSSLEPQSALLTVGRRIVLNFLNGIDRCCAHCEWPLGSGAATWRVPVFYRSQSALTVSSWGEMSFKSCAEEVSGLEDAACTPPIFQKDLFFDATDGSSAFFQAGVVSESTRIGAHDDMHSLPRSDQSTEDALNHLLSPDRKVMGWLSNAGAGHMEQDVNQPPEAPASHGVASPGGAALTGDCTAAADGAATASAVGEEASASAASTSPVHPAIPPRQPQAPASTYNSFHSASSPDKKQPSFWDDGDDDEVVDHPAAGLLPRQDLGDSDEESATPGVRSLSANVHAGVELSQTMTRSPASASRDTLTLALDRDLPSAAEHMAEAAAVHAPLGRPTTASSSASLPMYPPAQASVPKGKAAPHPQQQRRHHQERPPNAAAAGLLQLSHTRIRSYSDDLCRLSETTPGLGLLKFRDRYVFAVHLIYALLRGRPVVVLGKTEGDVTAMVRTLSVFVPGHSSHHQIIEWFTEPINISHLSRIKLIGLRKGRQSMIPQSVKPYVSILDYDTSTLTTPPYKGNFVSNIVHRQKKWMDDRSYLAYIHSVFLQMGSKAFLYFHNFCLNVPLLRREKSSRMQAPAFPEAPERFTQSRASKNGFLTHLGITECDKHIIEYFVHVVKMQQMNQFRHSNNMDGEDYPPSIHLDHSKCNVYQGRRPVGRFS